MPVALEADEQRRPRGLAVRARPGAACGSSCRSAARSAACSIWRRATPRWPIRSHFGDGDHAAFDALDTLRVVLSLPALPRRIECFDISTLQGRETVASMVVCVDGRMRRGEYRKFRIRGSRAATAPDRSGHRLPEAAHRGPRILDDFASMHEVVLRRYRQRARAGRAVSRSDPDRRRQGAARRRRTRRCEELGLRTAGRGRHRQAGGAAVHARPRRGMALPREHPALRADAAHSRRGAPLRGHVPSPARARAATCGRSSTTSPASARGAGRQLLTAFGSVAGVRRASREELRPSSARKAAERVLRHFAAA